MHLSWLIVAAVTVRLGAVGVVVHAFGGALSSSSPQRTRPGVATKRRFTTELKSSSIEDNDDDDDSWTTLPLLSSSSTLRFPLPSEDLPDELATLHIYAIPLETPVDQAAVDYFSLKDELDNNNAYIGHMASASVTVGATGVASRVLAATDPPEEDKKSVLLCRGGFRFKVRKVLQEIPFAIVQVEKVAESEDDGASSSDAVKETSTEEEDDDDDDDLEHCTKAELLERLSTTITDYCHEISKEKELNPLERSLVEPGQLESERSIREENAANWQVFVALTDPTIATADNASFLAAELMDMKTEERKQLLQIPRALERLRFVVRHATETLGLLRARAVTDQFLAENNQQQADLQVGQPTLPLWAKTISKGTQVEYYWNEEYEWCLGTVVEEPRIIAHEILLTIQFSDGETHTIPLSADEKARWRPPQED